MIFFVFGTMKQRWRDLVRAEQERRWLRKNRKAIAQYNRRVAERGLLSDDAGPLQRL
jgi:post-segregation antitoxin (ccd killing protein)